MSDPTRWRLLVQPDADGAWNMALDEAILEGYVASREPRAPTLRLYGWRPTALSLGRFQSADDCDRDYLRQEAIDLVRRPTGGAAVLHGDERTYAVIGMLRREPFCGTVLSAYETIARWLCAALRSIGADARAESGKRRARRGTEACFAASSAHEITIGASKIVGSAQLRRRGAFLQHGSIPIVADAERSRRAIRGAGPARAERGLSQWVGADARERLDRALVSECERSFGVRLEPAEPEPAELERAALLRAWKYLSTRWTIEGREPQRRA